MSATTAAAPPAPAVPFGQALRFWLKLGFISFGGPAGQIAILHRELVERRRWISESRFLHALNYCMLLPGPEAQQLATYLGWLMHRTRGGIAAGVLFVLPSLALLLLLSGIYMAWGTLPLVAGIFYGIKPAVAAIVLQALHRIAGRSLGPPRQWPVPWALALASFLALTLLQLPFPAVVLSALALGGLLSRVAPQALRTSGGAHAATPAAAAPALIDEHTPTPDHARFSRARLGRVLAVGGLLWLAPMAALVAAQGWNATLAQMGWFFTKAALLTFGGAYAVLPYVQQAAVGHHGWLTTLQMMDGLALGETTPGPLIMVVTFVGFVGGWTQQVLGPDARLLGAALAGCVATWFTFLPSFVFILAGGPWVESTRGKLGLTLPLAAVTCAVVGVIAHLALWFLGAVVFPSGLTRPPDLWALALAGLSFWLLWRRGWGVIPLIGAAALAGLALRLAGWA